MNTNNPNELIFSISRGVIVRPIYYDKLSGEVSYVIPGHAGVMTCFDYDLNCAKGINVKSQFLENLQTAKPEKYKISQGTWLSFFLFVYLRHRKKQNMKGGGKMKVETMSAQETLVISFIYLVSIITLFTISIFGRPWPF